MYLLGSFFLRSLIPLLPYTLPFHSRLSPVAVQLTLLSLFLLFVVLFPTLRNELYRSQAARGGQDRAI